MVLIGSGFVGGFLACQDEKATPPRKEKMKGDYPLSSPETKKTPPLSSPETKKTPPPEEETIPKEENAPAPE